MKKQKNNIKAVIFDMDGLIVDTEKIESKNLDILLKEYGKTPRPFPNGLLHIVGPADNQTFLDFMKKYEITEDVEVFRKRKRVIFEELLAEKLILFPGCLDLLILLKKNKIKIALASNRFEKFIHIILDNLEIKEHFEVIVGPNEKRRHKPFPDIYIDTASVLSVKPEECVVLEDSETGIISAKSAGMKVIAIPNAYTKDHDFSKADLVTNSLENITIDIINTI